MTSQKFTFEHLEVYQMALDWVEITEDLLTQYQPQINYSLADQLSRASTSIAINIAEANGRWNKTEKRHFFWIARGSVCECIAIIEILRRRRLFSEDQRDAHRERLAALGKILS